MSTSPSSRRRFLRQLLGAGALTLAGLDSLAARTTASGPVAAQPFRFAFVTDLHLMADPALRSAEGIATCLAAVEKLSPRPDFILVGGDLVNDSPYLTLPQAEKSLSLFLKIWRDHTSLPAHWMFGNHDLAGTSNPASAPEDPSYGKGLFRDRFDLPRLYYSFHHKGWRFIVLDDIGLAHGVYTGQLFDDELRYLRADLDAHRTLPTILCSHIPMISNVPLALDLAHAAGIDIHGPRVVVCKNAPALFVELPGHNIRAMLSGHLHHYEKIVRHGVPFITSGAVCGNFWKGPVLDCPEGFGVVDLGADGSVDFDYRGYGWKTTA